MGRTYEGYVKNYAMIMIDLIINIDKIKKGEPNNEEEKDSLWINADGQPPSVGRYRLST
jgi:hypothetical protein